MVSVPIRYSSFLILPMPKRLNLISSAFSLIMLSIVLSPEVTIRSAYPFQHTPCYFPAVVCFPNGFNYIFNSLSVNILLFQSLFCGCNSCFFPPTNFPLTFIFYHTFILFDLSYHYRKQRLKYQRRKRKRRKVMSHRPKKKVKVRVNLRKKNQRKTKKRFAFPCQFIKVS